MIDGSEVVARESHWFAGCGDNQILKFKIDDEEKFVDDLAGRKLDPNLCRAARQKGDGRCPRQRLVGQARSAGVLG